MFSLGRREGILLLALAVLLVAGLVVKVTVFAPEVEPVVIEPGREEDEAGAGTETEAEVDIYVHVAGAVANPGVYSLPEGSRVFQALEAAGGARADADLAAINLAAILQDGQQVYIPLPGEAVPGLAGQPADSGLININTATMDQLMALPGIGEVKAGRIIDYRQKNGPFSTVDELINVSGIAEKTLEGIRDLITIR